MTPDACDACLRRTWLVAELGGHLDVAWKRRRDLRDVLALSDEDLIDALAGATADRVRAALERFEPGQARRSCEKAGLEAACRHSPRYPSRLRTGGRSTLLSRPSARSLAGTTSLSPCWY